MKGKVKKVSHLPLRVMTLPEEASKDEETDPRGCEARAKLAEISMDTLIDAQTDQQADWTIKQDANKQKKLQLRIDTHSQGYIDSNHTKLSNRNTGMNFCSTRQRKSQLEKRITINRYQYNFKKKEVRRKSCFSLLFDCQKYYKDKRMLTKQVKNVEPIVIERTNLFNELIMKAAPFCNQRRERQNTSDVNSHRPSFLDQKMAFQQSFANTAAHFHQADQLKFQHTVSATNKQNKTLQSMSKQEEQNYGDPAQLKQRVFVFNGNVLKTERNKLFSRIRRSRKQNASHSERSSL